MKKAIELNRRRMKTVDTVLRGWLDNGVKTTTEADEQEKTGMVVLKRMREQNQQNKKLKSATNIISELQERIDRHTLTEADEKKSENRLQKKMPS